MSPTKEAPRYFGRIEAERVARHIDKHVARETGKERNIIGEIVWDAFYKQPKVGKGVEQVEIYGQSRPVLAIVTHGLQVEPEQRMMYWIPLTNKNPRAGTPENEILRAFGIYSLENFRRTRVGPLLPAEDQTRMSFYHRSVNEEWMFYGYDRNLSSDFEDLRETLWVIAMLPDSVIKEALERKHFLLVSKQIDRDGEDSEESKLTIASVTKGLNKILVENFQYKTDAYQRGEIEENTPVALFYHY